jgi:hypothetical protein
MKRTLATVLTLALALPLLAEEAKKSEETPKTAPADSPLVAAAKRSNRLGKKPSSKVITNQTLKTSGANAHVTTTSSQTSLEPMLKRPAAKPTPEMIAAEQAAQRRKAEAEAAAKKQEAQQKQAHQVRAAAENVEEEYPDDVDPAQAEKQMRDANAPPPADKKPPR